MKTHIKNLFFLPGLMAGLGLLPAGRGTAQTFTTLYSLSFRPDGTQPSAGLILSGNTLYGTAEQGGNLVGPTFGTVFALKTDGTGITNLHDFAASSINSSGVFTNSDGGRPKAGLLLSGNVLYGTASIGGSSGAGTVFAVNTNGTGFTNLHSFTATSDSPSHTNSDGASPLAGLI